jgi:aminoacrylate hydrolase
MTKVNSGGVEIDYEILNAASDKTPVFFISGLAGVRQGLVGQAEHFKKTRPVVLHDHRGTGLSAKPEGVYSVANMAADVIAIMDDAGIDRAHLAGFSTGGAIIQHLCLDHGDRVQSAAISCSWSRPDPFFIRQFEVRKQVLLELGTEAVTHLSSTALNDPAWFVENFETFAAAEKHAIETAPPPIVAAQRMDAIMAHDVHDRLGQISTPVLVACAKNDVVCPPHCSRAIAAAIPGAELKLYDDGGHFFFVARRDEFNADLERFIVNKA